MCVIPTKEWDIPEDCPHAVDAKKWYCPKCGVKYLPKWGQLVCIEHYSPEKDVTTYHYMKAECPLG